jgi:hypothetical protein
MSTGHGEPSRRWYVGEYCPVITGRLIKPVLSGDRGAGFARDTQPTGHPFDPTFQVGFGERRGFPKKPGLYSASTGAGATKGFSSADSAIATAAFASSAHSAM